jgi:hypothetical protein
MAIQLDTVSIVNRLAVDDNLRTALLAEATRISNATEMQEDQVRQYYDVLSKTGVLYVPRSFAEWSGHWQHVNPGGFVISVLLLSLGAPFWFSMLKKLVQLRSVIAQKDDAERQVRQTSQEAVLTPAGPAPIPSGLLAGERGDMAAVG